MTIAVQFTDTATDVGTDGPAVLKKRWNEAPAQNTSVNPDSVITCKSESDDSLQPHSSWSLFLADREFGEPIFRGLLTNQQILSKKMLLAMENTNITSFFGSTNLSIQLLDFHPRQFDAQSVKDKVERLFSLSTFLELESGMTNALSEGLEKVVETYGGSALEEIQELILEERIPFTIAAETLRYIGNTESNRYAEGRRKLLESCLLNSGFMLVRDGAAAGISYIDDSKSIPCLIQAIERESHAELKHDLLEVLELLQDTSAE